MTDHYTGDMGMVDETAATKVISCNDGEATQHTIIVTKLDGESSTQLSRVGCRSETTFFMLVDGGICYGHYDPYKLQATAGPLSPSGHTIEVLRAIHFGEIKFEELEHDEEIMPYDARLTDDGSGREETDL